MHCFIVQLSLRQGNMCRGIFPDGGHRKEPWIGGPVLRTFCDVVDENKQLLIVELSSLRRSHASCVALLMRSSIVVAFLSHATHVARRIFARRAISHSESTGSYCALSLASCSKE